MPEPITAPYLLCLNVPSYLDREGRRYHDRLWHKDLVAHTKYIADLTVVTPCWKGATPPDAVAWRERKGVRFVDLRQAKSTLRALLLLPAWTASIWAAMSRAKIVHTGIADWPIPVGWIAAPMARLRKRFCVVIVESAPWRSGSRGKAILFETLGRWCMRCTDLAIYTQEEYRASLPPAKPECSYISAASWLDDGDLLSGEDAGELWRRKRADGRLRLLFAGRLHRDKGVEVILEAVRRCPEEVCLDVLGDGPLAELCAAAVPKLPGRVAMLGTVPYGPALFERLRQYHALVVPSVSDEQPRVVYDAYSQALPVLASDTAGLRSCVRDGSTGRFAPVGDSGGWAELLQWCLHNRAGLEEMGLRALEEARGVTHERMHSRRADRLWAMLAGEGRQG